MSKKLILTIDLAQRGLRSRRWSQHRRRRRPPCRTAPTPPWLRASSTSRAPASQVGDLRLTNISPGHCWTRGYPGVSYVGFGNGTQIGRAATWDAGTVRRSRWHRQHADAPIRLVNVQNYPASTCRPTPVDGLRVYVPGSTLAKFVPYRTTGCRSTSVTTIFVKPLPARPVAPRRGGSLRQPEP